VVSRPASARSPEPDPGVPLEWWRLHQASQVGERVRFGPLPRADWPNRILEPVVEGAGFVDPVGRTRAGMVVVSAVRARTLADTVGPGMRLLLVGLNPSLYSADVGSGFARPGNRFWPAALEAGIVSLPRDPLDALVSHGVGMTDLVKRATRAAAELEPDEYRAGVERLEFLAGWLAPGAVCVIGLAGWRAAVDRTATAGWQPRSLGGRPTYVMPNPSGLNAHDTVASLAAHLRAAALGPDS
jgi:TDG/mug DNA glycosylase family protein